MDVNVKDGCMDQGGFLLLHGWMVNNSFPFRNFPKINGEILLNWPDYEKGPPKKQCMHLLFCNRSFAETTDIPSAHGTEKRDL